MFISRSLIHWRWRRTQNRKFYNEFRGANSVGANSIGCETGSILMYDAVCTLYKVLKSLPSKCRTDLLLKKILELSKSTLLTFTAQFWVPVMVKNKKTILKRIDNSTRPHMDRRYSTANSRLCAACLMGYGFKIFSPVSCNDITRSPGGRQVYHAKVIEKIIDHMKHIDKFLVPHMDTSLNHYLTRTRMVKSGVWRTDIENLKHHLCYPRIYLFTLNLQTLTSGRSFQDQCLMARNLKIVVQYTWITQTEFTMA